MYEFTRCEVIFTRNLSLMLFLLISTLQIMKCSIKESNNAPTIIKPVNWESGSNSDILKQEPIDFISKP